MVLSCISEIFHLYFHNFNENIQWKTFLKIGGKERQISEHISVFREPKYISYFKLRHISINHWLIINSATILAYGFWYMMRPLLMSKERSYWSSVSKFDVRLYECSLDTFAPKIYGSNMQRENPDITRFWSIWKQE